MSKTLKRIISAFCCLILLPALTASNENIYHGIQKIIDIKAFASEETRIKHLSVVPDGYIGIYTVEDLDAVKNNPSANYILMNDIGLYSHCICSESFNGIFDGNMFSICLNTGQALFSTLESEGIIKNLKITGNIRTGSNEYSVFDTLGISDGRKRYVSSGSIVGFVYTNNGLIENVDFNCYVSINQSLIKQNMSEWVYNHSVFDCYSTACAFVYSNYGTIKMCHVGGSVSAFAKASGNNGSIKYSSYAYSYGLTRSNSGTILDCYADAVVSASANSTYTTGTSTGSFTGNTTSKTCGINESQTATGIIRNCYSTNKGNGVNVSQPITCGSNFINCYYPSTLGTEYNGTPIDNQYMCLQEKYVGFDFDNVWIINENSDYKYPQLRANLGEELDFSDLEEKIAMIPEDLSVYTDNSAAALNEALNNIENAYSATDQETINSYVESLTAALDSLYLEPTVSLDNDRIIRGQRVTWTVTTPDDVAWLRFTNNYTTFSGSSGTIVTSCKYDKVNTGSTEITVSDEDGTRIWIISMPMTYPGTSPSANETVTLEYKRSGSKVWKSVNSIGEGGEKTPYEKSIIVAKSADLLTNSTPGYEKFSIVSVQADKEAGTLTVVTTDDVSKIRVCYTDLDTGKIKSLAYQTTSTSVISCESENGLTTWTVKFKFKNAEDDSYNVQARGSAWGEGTTVVVH